MTADPDKHDLIRWADDRREIDLQSKVILQKFALFADDEGVTWRPVAKLAADANCSIRTVHTRLRWLEERGYLRQTGEMHRLKNSTRSVPKYILQPSFEQPEEAAAAPESMYANSAHIAVACVQAEAGMCATGCTPNETLESQNIQKGAGARADEDLAGLAEAYDRVERAYPPEALGYTDNVMAKRALADLIGQGVSIDDLVAAAADFAESPRLKTRSFGPVGLQRWLGEGRYRGFGPFLARAKAARGVGVAKAGAVAVEPAGWAGPAEVWAAVAARLGEAAAGSCLSRARWDGERRAVVAASSWAFGKLREAAGIFEQHGCELVAPNGGE